MWQEIFAEIFTVSNKKSVFFSAVKLRSPVSCYKRCGGTSLFHVHFYPEDGGNPFL
jgi:hypothetical protein